MFCTWWAFPRLYPGLYKLRSYVSLLHPRTLHGFFHVASNGQGYWTLAIEEQFYLLWPTVVRRRSVEELRRWALSIGVTAVLLRSIAAIFGHHNYYFTFFRCDGLAFGAFLACWFAQRDIAAATSSRESRAIALGFFSGVALIVLSMLQASAPRSVAFLAAFLQIRRDANDVWFDRRLSHRPRWPAFALPSCGHRF